jgi:hypothetical protein
MHAEVRRIRVAVPQHHAQLVRRMDDGRQDRGQGSDLLIVPRLHRSGIRLLAAEAEDHRRRLSRLSAPRPARQSDGEGCESTAALGYTYDFKGTACAEPGLNTMPKLLALASHEKKSTPYVVGLTIPRASFVTAHVRLLQNLSVAR